MDVPDLMTAMAGQLARYAPLHGHAYYPPPDRILHSPTVVIRQSNETPTTYTKARAGQQVVLAMIDVLVLVEKVMDTDKPSSEAKIDQLITPILDLFDVSAEGGSVNARLPGLDDHVDRIWHDALVRRGVVRYGQQECYAAVITMDGKFKRTPQTVTLEGTP